MTLYQYLESTSGVRSYLEIGCQEGNSLRRVVLANGELADIVVCDTWGGSYGGTGRSSHAHISEMLSAIGYAGRVQFLDGDSKQLIPTLQGRKFDLILVDGDHSDEGGNADLRNVNPLLADGGVILFHDICHPAHAGLRGVAERFVRDVGRTAVYHEDAEGMAVIR